MEIIKSIDAYKKSNSSKCQTTEYSFKDKSMDLGISTIKGRYPEKGYCINLVSKELIYVLAGSGKLCLEDELITFTEGDSLLISNNEKYYWESKYCKIAIISSPAWNIEQYKIVK